MNLYEIDAAIQSAFDAAVDPETGEIIPEEYEKLNALQVEFDRKAENIACWIKNLKAEAEAYKAEKLAFAERQKRAENKAESLKRYLSNVLNGQKQTYQRAAISFRKSEAVVLEDDELFVEYAQASSRNDLLTFKAPEVNKTALKDALKKGEEIRYAHIEERENIQIK